MLSQRASQRLLISSRSEPVELSVSQSRNYRIPGGVLGKFVELLWLYDIPARTHAQERMLPTATTELVIELAGGTANSPGALVVGPHSQHWALDTSRAATVIGVHFRPGGAFPFFGVPAGELHNARVSLEALWGADAANLVEEVLAGSSPAAMFDVLERLLLGAARTFTRHRAVDFALQALSGPLAHNVADVAHAVGMSQRRFRERFRGEVGMAPKLYARVQRFQAVVAGVQTLRDVSWTDIAGACGYFDQAHFIHDFRAFSGFTPAQYFTLKGSDLNHVPLPR
jgi:AraC-like DNA-binding protein